MWRWTRRIFLGFLGLLLVAAVLGATYQSRTTRRDLTATPPPGRLVDVGGHSLHIWCEGSDNPTVILDSGLGGTAFDWRLVRPEVSQFTEVCSYDRAGMGYSDEGPMPRTSRQIAVELELLIRRSEIERPVILVGHSFGGFNMRIFASEYEEQVAGLVLVDASHEDQGQRNAEAGVPDQLPGQLTRSMIPLASSLGILRLLNITLGAPVELTPEPVREFLRATVHRTSRYRTMANELANTQESGAQLRATRRGLNFPLIVLSRGLGSGPAAEVHRQLQRDQVSLSSRSCQVIARGSGHMIQFDQPKTVVKAIRTLVDISRDSNAELLCAE